MAEVGTQRGASSGHPVRGENLGNRRSTDLRNMTRHPIFHRPRQGSNHSNTSSGVTQSLKIGSKAVRFSDTELETPVFRVSNFFFISS